VIVGAGALTLPLAFQNAGLILGTILLIVYVIELLYLFPHLLGCVFWGTSRPHL
jgi:amino acid permease